MKVALAAVIDRHPAFNACMVRESTNIGLHYGAIGADFSVCYSVMDYPDLRSEKSLTSDVRWLEGSNADDSPPNENTMDYRLNSDWPVARFRLIFFRHEGCALLLHVLSQGDGSAVVQFLENWSRAYSGQPLSSSSGYSNMRVEGLADLPGPAPSDGLNNLQYSALSVEENQTLHDGGSLRLDISGAAIQHFVNECRLHGRLSLSSSDVLHALVWRCFAAALPRTNRNADDHTGGRDIRLYTLFDPRGIGAPGIPSDHDGSTALHRCAEMAYRTLLNSTIPNLAMAFRQPIKPSATEGARNDSSYLARGHQSSRFDEEGNYEESNYDENNYEDGNYQERNYANFVIGAWLDCRSAGSIIVNDLRRMGAADIRFEERPARMETIVSPAINMVSIYHNDDGTITLHYVGERSTLPVFSRHLKATLAAGATHVELDPD